MGRGATRMTLAGLILTLAALWILILARYGLISVPTRPGRIRAALHLADLKPGEAFFTCVAPWLAR